MESLPATGRLDKEAERVVRALAVFPRLQGDLLRTLVILKPDFIRDHSHAIGDVLTKFGSRRLMPVAMSMGQFPFKFWESFYACHIERPMFKSLIKFMASGPVVPIVFDGPDDVAVVETARFDVMPEIRFIYGAVSPENKIHASDGAFAAKNEIPFFFSEWQIRRL